MFYKASGIWPGGAARPAAASAGAVDPRGICVPWAAMDACCWRRSRSNNRQEMIYCSYRDVLLPRAARTALKNIVTQGSSVGYNSRLNLSYFEITMLTL